MVSFVVIAFRSVKLVCLWSSFTDATQIPLGYRTTERIVALIILKLTWKTLVIFRCSYCNCSNLSDSFSTRQKCNRVW